MLVLYFFFLVISRHPNFMCQHCGTHCLFHFHTRCEMEETECTETSTHRIQTPGNHPEARIQHLEQGESLKSRKIYYCLKNKYLFHFLLLSYELSEYKILC
jgi:hypothetical protein